ncbi:MAG: GatB/YqeY domain-containing protein [Patescibacteria group bacterium]
MTLQQTIKAQMMESMKAKDAVRVGVLRGLMSSFTNELVKLERTPQDELKDEETLAVIQRAVKQRKDSIQQFVAGGREDLAVDEKAELIILEAYLPAMMKREDVMLIAVEKMAELGINDKTKAGLFIGALMKDLKGKADGDVVKSVVDELLGK